jgi:hypothetical protein
MNYTWKILRLGTQDHTNNDGEILNDAIVYIKWKKIGTVADHDPVEYLGTTKLNVDALPAADFVHLDSVTEADIISWVQEELSVDTVAAINKTLQARLDKQQVSKFKPNF